MNVSRPLAQPLVAESTLCYTAVANAHQLTPTPLAFFLMPPPVGTCKQA